MTGVVFVHGVRKPGWVYVGTGPKTGQPRDAEGRMILVHEYAPPAGTGQVTGEVPQVAPPSPPRVSRGVAATVQDSLL